MVRGRESQHCTDFSNTSVLYLHYGILININHCTTGLLQNIDPVGSLFGTALLYKSPIINSTVATAAAMCVFDDKNECIFLTADARGMNGFSVKYYKVFCNQYYLL